MSFFSSLLNNMTKYNVNQPPNVYLQCNEQRIQFPVLPSEFEVNVKQNNSSVNINNIGELNMLGKTDLITLSISSFFPNQDYNFLQCTRETDPYSYVKTIESWRTCGKPSRFIISGTPVNYAVSIDTFKWGIKDGTGDVYFSLDLKEYKFIGNALDNTQISKVTGLRERADFSKSVNNLKTVTVYPGDSLMDVAGKALGQNLSVNDNNASYLKLYKSLAKSDGIKVGDTLTIKNGLVKVGDKNVYM